MLNIIMGKSKSGKTTELVKLSAEGKIPIICASKNNVKNVKEIAEKLNLNIPEPISVIDFIKTADFSKINSILIDDLDLVLQIFLGAFNIVLVSATMSYDEVEL